MNDYFALVYKKHKSKIDMILNKTKANKEIKLQNYTEIIEKKREQRQRIIDNLSELAKEPIKTHLLFKKLEEGKDSSWKSILFNFYNVKLPDLNKFTEERKKQFSFLRQIDTLPFIRTFSFKLNLTSPFYTASENKFYSIPNSIAKERPTGIPILKGSSLKGALRQAAVECIEDELLNKNYGSKFEELVNKNEDEILNSEKEDDDKFFFKKRARLVKLFGNEKNARWFTFRSLLATGGIKNASKIEEVLNRISSAFERYLKNKRIIKDENTCRGRLIFSDLYFNKVALDVITPLDRKKKTPVSGPIYYEVVPEGSTTTGTIIWFPFDLIAEGAPEEKIEKEWEEDKKILKKAFKKLAEIGIGAKTKAGWGRFSWEEM